jgi:hypothetical protein
MAKQGALLPREGPPPSALRRRPLLAGALLMVAVCTIFAGYSVLAHSVLGSGSNAKALAFAWVRDAIGATLLLATAYATERAAFWPAIEDWPRLLACGFAGVWGAQGFSALALANLNATLFAVLEQLLPVVSLLACVALGEERFALLDALSWAKAGGVALAVGGAAFLAYTASRGGGASGAGGLDVGNANLPLGLAFTSVQLLLGGSYSAVQKPLLRRYPPVVVAAWGYASGLCLLTLSVIPSATADAWTFSPLGLAAVAYAGVLSSFFAYGAMAVANQLAGPLFLTSFYPIQPIATAVIAAVALGARFSLEEVGGAAIVSVGLLCVVGAKALEGAREEKAAGGKAGGEAVDRGDGDVSLV